MYVTSSENCTNDRLFINAGGSVSGGGGEFLNLHIAGALDMFYLENNRH